METFEEERASLYAAICHSVIPEYFDSATFNLYTQQVMALVSKPTVVHHLVAFLSLPEIHPNVLSCVASNLKNIISSNWSLFSYQDQVALYNKVFEILVKSGKELFSVSPSTINSVAKVASTLLRQSWNEVAEFRTVVKFISDFVEAEPQYKYIGFVLAGELIQDMSPVVEHVRANHKRNSARFRLEALSSIFNILVQHLSVTVDSGLEKSVRLALTQKLLEALINAMEFDCPSDKKGSAVEVTVPELASPHWTALLSPEVPERLWTVFSLSIADSIQVSNDCLMLLSLLSSVKRTFYPSDEARLAFLQIVVDGCAEILNSSSLTSNYSVMYYFNKLAARLSLNGVISDMADYPSAQALVDKMFVFTVAYLKELAWDDKLVVYILHFWDGIVEGVQSFSQNSDKVRGAIAEVSQCYVTSLMSLKALGKLEDEEAEVGKGYNKKEVKNPDRLEQLTVLTSIARIDYAGLAGWLCQKFKETVETCLNDTTAVPRLKTLVKILQSMVANSKTKRTILAPVPRGQPNTTVATYPELKAVAEMTWFVIQLAEAFDSTPQVQSEGLYNASLSFLRTFIEIYFRFGVQEAVIEGIHTPLAAYLGLTDPNQVLTRLVGVLIKTIDFLATSRLCLKSLEILGLLFSNSRVIAKTAGAPQEIYIGRLVFDQQVALGILQSFVSNSGSFLDRCASLKARMHFYKITVVLFERLQKSFQLQIEAILEPLEARFLARETLDADALVVLLTDYTGFISGVRKGEHFAVVFHRYVSQGIASFIVDCLTAFSHDRTISKALLGFLLELSHSIEGRISKSHEVGFPLFRHLLSCLTVYLNIWPTLAVEDEYKERFVPFAKVLSVHSHIFEADYINIGMMANLGDSELKDHVALVLSRMITLRLEDVVTHSKLFLGLYDYLGNITKHGDLALFFMRIPPESANVLLELVIEGSQSLVLKVCLSAFSIVNNLMTFIMKKSGHGDKEAVVTDYVAACGPQLKRLLKALFSLLTEPNAVNYGTISVGLFGLIMLFKEDYKVLEAEFIASSPNQAYAQEAICKLWNGINPPADLSPESRDNIHYKTHLFSSNARHFVEFLKRSN